MFTNNYIKIKNKNIKKPTPGRYLVVANAT